MNTSSVGYDKCRTCGHNWHGLECAHKQDVIGNDGRWTTTPCACPSQFGVTYEDDLQG
jgi:hypothetical protein